MVWYSCIAHSTGYVKPAPEQIGMCLGRQCVEPPCIACARDYVLASDQACLDGYSAMLESTLAPDQIRPDL